MEKNIEESELMANITVDDVREHERITGKCMLLVAAGKRKEAEELAKTSPVIRKMGAVVYEKLKKEEAK